ncbi:MAG: PQQ-binding-like beta-propeller repeat protein [Proteobacteria bacterium]|nr:PQQ-binding-like beta-propeller repeat protein [Pseudomonadota bacterium]
MDLKTGAIRWHKQMTADDAFTAACVAHNADPVARKGCGPDVDFGSSAILRTLPNGKRVLLAGQKWGVMHAVDPDAQGAVLWQKRLSPGGVLGGIEWGYAADDKHVYVPISDVWESRSEPGAAGGIYALNIADGSTVWQTPAQKPDCLSTPGCNAGQPQAAVLIRARSFSGSMDGHMRAYDPATGKVIWDVDTKREFPTVNGVKAKGRFDQGRRRGGGQRLGVLRFGLWPVGHARQRLRGLRAQGQVRLSRPTLGTRPAATRLRPVALPGGEERA